MLLGYGLDIKETDDPYVKRAEIAIDSILDITGSGIYLVDIFPVLRYVPSWVPGATFQKEAKVRRQLQEDFRQLFYEETLRNIVRLIFTWSFKGIWLTVDRPLEALGPH